MIIAIDFDGTCVAHEFPKTGKDIGAVPVLKDLVKDGNKLILFTMRSDNEKGDHLTQAVQWFKDNGIELWGIQKNPTQHKWSTSPKAYAEIYIDDANLGCPLILDKNVCERPFVDWREVSKKLFLKGALKADTYAQEY